MMGTITKENLILVSKVLHEWSGCEVKAMETDGSVADPMQGRRGWIAFKDERGLVNYIDFTNEGLVSHG